ncbi:MAG TPA: permease [Saprospiraceae bacterium]|nr:permease [Saprospiraceae bacterium]
MNIALQKAIVFILLIFLGIFLKKKVGSGSEVNSLKALILNVALPATVFIALLKIDVDQSFIYLPFIALLFNVVLWYSTKAFLRFSNIQENSSQGRTLQLLIPSFAPGLSTFAIISEFLGDKVLAMAAFADVGNKIFVLLIMYLISMHWYYQVTQQKVIDLNQRWGRLKQLIKALLQEPINIALIIALTLVFLGYNISVLPLFLRDSVEKMAVMMTPLVLIFIGLTVKLRKNNVVILLQSILWRSGVAFLLSAGFLFLLPASLPLNIQLLIIVLPQSACSFWPFAHMSMVNDLNYDNNKPKIFKLDMAVNLLALSLPFSTIISLIICSTGELFTSLSSIIYLGISLLSLSILPFVIHVYQVFKRSLRIYKTKTLST